MRCVLGASGHIQTLQAVHLGSVARMTFAWDMIDNSLPQACTNECLACTQPLVRHDRNAGPVSVASWYEPGCAIPVTLVSSRSSRVMQVHAARGMHYQID
jgi:hypothetical protein